MDEYKFEAMRRILLLERLRKLRQFVKYRCHLLQHQKNSQNLRDFVNLFTGNYA